MCLVECTLIRLSLANLKKREKFNKPTTQQSSGPSGRGNVRFVLSFFLHEMFIKFNFQQSLLKLEGTRSDKRLKHEYE